MLSIPAVSEILMDLSWELNSTVKIKVNLSQTLFGSLNHNYQSSQSMQ